MMGPSIVISGGMPELRRVSRPLGRWWRRLAFSEDSMAANPDFKDLFNIFNEEQVEYLLAGAHAVIFFSEPRYTKDLDIWVNPTAENAKRVFAALTRFGAPLKNISVTDFCDKEMIYQIGVEPNRIDILMGIAGVEFGPAWVDRVESTYDGIPIHVMGKESLQKAKKASGRPQDLLDLEKLQ